MLFKPSGNQPLKKTYPELNDYEEFKNLIDKEMLFTLYYGVKNSPYHHKKPFDRVIAIFKEIPEYAKSLSEELYEDFGSLKFPAHITEAIKVWAKFNPDMRQASSSMYDKIISDFEFVVHDDIEGKINDSGAIKNLIEMRISIAKSLPSIINAAEMGFGTKSKAEKEKKSLNVFESED